MNSRKPLSPTPPAPRRTEGTGNTPTPHHVTPTLVDMLCEGLTEAEQALLRGIRPTSDTTSLAAETHRMKAMACASGLLASSLCAQADLPDWGDLLNKDGHLAYANEPVLASDMTLVIYRLLVERLPTCGPLQRAPLQRAIDAVRWLVRLYPGLLGSMQDGQRVLHIHEVVMPYVAIFRLGLAGRKGAARNRWLAYAVGIVGLLYGAEDKLQAELPFADARPESA